MSGALPNSATAPRRPVHGGSEEPFGAALVVLDILVIRVLDPWDAAAARDRQQRKRSGQATASFPIATRCHAGVDELEITTTLAPRGPAGAIVLDDDQVAQIGGGAKVFPVKVTVNDRPARLRLARMGGESLIGFNKQVRAELGVEIGDQVHAVIERDDAPREIAIPEELQQALDADTGGRSRVRQAGAVTPQGARAAIAEAKRPETRAKRVAATIEALRAGS